MTPPAERWVFQLRSTEAKRSTTTYRWDIEEDWTIPLGRGRGPARGNLTESGPSENVRILTTASLKRTAVIRLFKPVALTRDEQVVTEALRLIEPSLSRIAVGSAATGFPTPSRKGSPPEDMVALIGDRRMPFGSLGEGMWRTLGLMLALVQCKNGYLLVDEIDTGLHYSTLAGLWEVVFREAAEHNVQVFATTHSRDCVDAMAAVCQEKPSAADGVTIQRVERGKPEAVAYSEGEMIAAADRGLEVR